MNKLLLLICFLFFCISIRPAEAQSRKTKKPVSKTLHFQLNKEDITKKDVHYTHLGSFASKAAGSRQGAAVYGNYLVQAHDKAGVDIFDISSKKLLKSGELQPAVHSNHCNNICFSDRFSDRTDQFPLLYISENHTSDIAVNRLASLDDEFKLVQHITLPKKIGFYLNAVFDFKNEYIFTICYREKNWRTNDGKNHLIVSKLRLPNPDEGDVTLKKIIEQFDIPFRTATQGAFFANGYIVHGFGINTEKKDDALLVIDPKTKQVARVIKTHGVFHDEIEGVSPYGDHSIVVTLQHGDVYQVDFR